MVSQRISSSTTLASDSAPTLAFRTCALHEPHLRHAPATNNISPYHVYNIHMNFGFAFFLTLVPQITQQQNITQTCCWTYFSKPNGGISCGPRAFHPLVSIRSSAAAVSRPCDATATWILSSAPSTPKRRCGRDAGGAENNGWEREQKGGDDGQWNKTTGCLGVDVLWFYWGLNTNYSQLYVCFFDKSLFFFFGSLWNKNYNRRKESLVFMAQMDRWIQRRVLVRFVVLPVGYIHGMEGVFLCKKTPRFSYQKSDPIWMKQKVFGATSLNGILKKGLLFFFSLKTA